MKIVTVYFILFFILKNLDIPRNLEIREYKGRVVVIYYRGYPIMWEIKLNFILFFFPNINLNKIE